MIRLLCILYGNICISNKFPCKNIDDDNSTRRAVVTLISCVLACVASRIPITLIYIQNTHIVQLRTFDTRCERNIKKPFLPSSHQQVVLRLWKKSQIKIIKHQSIWQYGIVTAYEKTPTQCTHT